MSHHHQHHHDHSHSQDPAHGELSETQKILKLLHHWVHHNADHAANYMEWAGKIEALGFAAAAEHLRKAAEMTHAITREFEAAEAVIRAQAPKD
jgi:hypothetical protein